MAMDRRSIIALPNKHLRQRSKKVGLITGSVKQLALDMQSALLDWEEHRQHEVGVALAAVQVDQLFRMIVIRNNFDDKDSNDFNTFINPDITKFEGQQIEDYEGCLSVPDVYGKVPRYEKIRLRALDLDGKPIRLTATGFLARIFQHEIDHTKGVVFIDHIKDNPEAFYRLTSEGQLESLNYESEVQKNNILW